MPLSLNCLWKPCLFCCYSLGDMRFPALMLECIFILFYSVSFLMHFKMNSILFIAHLSCIVELKAVNLGIPGGLPSRSETDPALLIFSMAAVSSAFDDILHSCRERQWLHSAGWEAVQQDNMTVTSVFGWSTLNPHTSTSEFMGFWIALCCHAWGKEKFQQQPAPITSPLSLTLMW